MSLGHNEFWDGRVVNSEAKYPENLLGFPNLDGQIWSSCNIKIWDAIGREATDKIVILGISSTVSSSNQEDTANAVIMAAVDLNYPQEHLDLIRYVYPEGGSVVA